MALREEEGHYVADDIADVPGSIVAICWWKPGVVTVESLLQRTYDSRWERYIVFLSDEFLDDYYKARRAHEDVDGRSEDHVSPAPPSGAS